MTVRLHDLNCEDNQKENGRKRTHTAVPLASLVILVLKIDLLPQTFDKLTLFTHFLLLILVSSLCGSFA